MTSSRAVALTLLSVIIILIWHFLPSSSDLLLVKEQSFGQKQDATLVAKKKSKPAPVEPAKSVKTEIDVAETIQQIAKTPVTKNESTVLQEKATSTQAPDFSSIKDVRLKKKTFFEFMYPRIVKANEKVARERAEIERLKKQWIKNKQLTSEEQKTFSFYEKKYREDKNKLDTLSKINNLLVKVDKVPASLILAQSANESAWGTSRFAKHGNNYFGQWCYRKGCGLVPSQRDDGSTHEVAKFGSVQKSVEEYIYNINVSRSYKDIRKLRQKMRNEGKSLDSLKLASGLSRYSERGKAYVKEIQSMIRFNKLQRYD